MENIQFANPNYFYLLILLPLMVVWYLLRQKRIYPSLNIPNIQHFEKTPKSIRIYLRHLPFVFRTLAVGLIIIALARPQTASTRQEVNTEGIDIIMSLDVSTSMLAEDLKPNRINAEKKTAINFIDKRVNDRVGLVIFASESFTQCPLTIDHAILKNLVTELKTGLLVDGTAIGNGLATAVSRLKDAKGKSKVIILLTDGLNNSGEIAPLTAAEIARNYGIRVYTIGVGTRGQAPYPFQTPYGIRRQLVDVQIDEVVLKNISAITGGKYFRATSTKALENIYSEIDKMEKVKIEVAYFHKKTELFFPLALAALILLFAELFFKYTIFRTIP